MTDNRCRQCWGKGKYTYTRNTYYDYEETCHVCKGTGKRDVVILTREEYEELTSTKNDS